MTERLTFRTGGWRYLVPNSLTAASLTLGSLASFLAITGHAYIGCWLVMMAVWPVRARRRRIQ